VAARAVGLVVSRSRAAIEGFAEALSNPATALLGGVVSAVASAQCKRKREKFVDKLRLSNPEWFPPSSLIKVSRAGWFPTRAGRARGITNADVKQFIAERNRWFEYMGLPSC